MLRVRVVLLTGILVRVYIRTVTYRTRLIAWLNYEHTSKYTLYPFVDLSGQLRTTSVR